MLKRFTKAASLIVLAAFVLFSNDSFQSSASSNDRGRKLYLQYCASCHGQDGTGNGIVAPHLKVAPPDLTTIAKQDGKFPAIHIQHVIAGEIGATELQVHGTKEMPVWGQVFRNKYGQGRSMLDVNVLTKYIESIQKATRTQP
jgi:mono/diheme cytochrome c family protein